MIHEGEQRLYTEEATSQRPPDTDQTISTYPNLLRRRRYGLIALVCIVALIGVSSAFYLRHRSASVEVYTVVNKQLKTEVAGGGLTYPVQSLTISYPVSAQVISVKVVVGQQVKPGQPLLTLDAAALTAHLAQLYDQEQAAIAYLNTLQQSGASASQIAAAQQQVDVAKSRYDALAAQIQSPLYKSGILASAFAGVVSSVNVVPGSWFNAGEPLLTIVDISTIIVRAQFPIEQRGLVHLGDVTEVDPQATPTVHLTGAVTAIPPVLSTTSSATFEVWISVPNPAGQLFANESVYARLTSLQTYAAVPEIAVINPTTDAIVFVQVNGIARMRHVVIGTQDGDQFGIVSGLQPGDQVIVSGQYGLADGQAVTPSK